MVVGTIPPSKVGAQLSSGYCINMCWCCLIFIYPQYVLNIYCVDYALYHCCVCLCTSTHSLHIAQLIPHGVIRKLPSHPMARPQSAHQPCPGVRLLQCCTRDCARCCLVCVCTGTKQNCLCHTYLPRRAPTNMGWYFRVCANPHMW